jgi:hypothetical protein
MAPKKSGGTDLKKKQAKNFFSGSLEVKKTEDDRAPFTLCINLLFISLCSLRRRDTYCYSMAPGCNCLT